MDSENELENTMETSYEDAHSLGEENKDYEPEDDYGHEDDYENENEGEFDEAEEGNYIEESYNENDDAENADESGYLESNQLDEENYGENEHYDQEAGHYEGGYGEDEYNDIDLPYQDDNDEYNQSYGAQGDEYPLGDDEYAGSTQIHFEDSHDVAVNDSLNDSAQFDLHNVRNSLDSQDVELSEEEKLRQRYLKVYRLAFEKNLQLTQQKQQAEDALENYFKMTKKQENKDKTLSSNAEERYKKLLDTHTGKRIELAKTKNKNNGQLREMLVKVQNKQSAAGKLQTSYLEYKMGSAAQAENSRTGKPIPEMKIEEIHQQHIKKDEEVRAIRTKYIYLSNQKDALEKSIKQKEFSDGLHLIDFEQFKMENATLNEKIEEKNESLQKSVLKARSTVHILTHVNEKLQFVQTEDIEMKQRLADLEKQLAVNKKLLAGLKDTRDHYKDQNIRMRDANPLIGNDQLLMDYESRKQELEDLRYKLKHLRNIHGENERKTSSTKVKINSMLETAGGKNQSQLFPNIHSQRV